MASYELVAKRYAKALWELAGSVTKAMAWVAPLEAFAKTNQESKDFHELMSSPAFVEADRVKVVEALADKYSAPKELKTFLVVLAQVGRFEVIEEIAEEFKKSILEAENTVEASVETAIALTESQEKHVVGILEKGTGKKVRLTVELAPDLVAGVRVRCGGKTIDASLVSNLESMQKTLLFGEA